MELQCISSSFLLCFMFLSPSRGSYLCFPRSAGPPNLDSNLVAAAQLGLGCEVLSPQVNIFIRGHNPREGLEATFFSLFSQPRGSSRELAQIPRFMCNTYSSATPDFQQLLPACSSFLLSSWCSCPMSPQRCLSFCVWEAGEYMTMFLEFYLFMYDCSAFGV